MESDRDRRFALEGFVRYHDDRIWKQTQKLVREEKEAITKMAVTLTAIRITACLSLGLRFISFQDGRSNFMYCIDKFILGKFVSSGVIDFVDHFVTEQINDFVNCHIKNSFHNTQAWQCPVAQE